ncbi:hypothetical protein D3C77_520390 [compost metagenome]
MHACIARHPVTQQAIDQKQRTTHCRRAHNQCRQWQIVGHRQAHLQVGIHAVTHHVQSAVELKVARRPGHGDRLSCHIDTFTGHQQAFDSIVTQAFVKQVGEVQPQASANGVEVEQAKYSQRLGAPFDFNELPLAQGGIEAAG